MESVTFEICSAENDPSDRTLGVMIRAGGVLIAARSYRVDPAVPLATVLLAMEHIAYKWQSPSLDEWEDFSDFLDEAGALLDGPST